MINYIVGRDDFNGAGDVINRAISNHLTTVSFITEDVSCVIYLLGNYALSVLAGLKKVQLCHFLLKNSQVSWIGCFHVLFFIRFK